MNDPFATIYAPSIVANIASFLLILIVTRWSSGPLAQLRQTRFGRILQRLKLLPEGFNDALNNCILHGAEIYFRDYPNYAISGVSWFLQDEVVLQQIALYFVEGEDPNETILNEALRKHFQLDTVGLISAQNRGLKLETVMPNFLAACEQSFREHLDNVQIALFYTEFTQARKTRQVIRAGVENIQNLISTRQNDVRQFSLSSLLDVAGAVQVITNDAEAAVPELRDAYNSGNLEKVAELLSKLKDPKRWSSIAEPTKARILSLEATLSLQIDKDPDKALRLVNEAEQWADLEEVIATRALILFQRDGVDVSLQSLEGKSDIRALNMKLSILLSARHFNQALDLISSIKNQNAETYRLIALYYLSVRDIASARENIKYAVDTQPNWVSVRFVDAVIKYWSSLSISALPPYLVAWPEAIDPALISSDAESLASLREAQQVFYSLTKYEHTPWVQEPSAWYIASLANDPEKQVEAQSYCRQALVKDATYIPAIMWSVTRNYDIDLTQSIEALEQSISQDAAELSQILVLLDCYISRKRFSDALDLLVNTESIFSTSDKVLWYVRKMQIHLAQKDFIGLENTFNSADLERDQKTRLREFMLFGYAVSRGDWLPLADHCERQYKDSHEPYELFKACEALYHARNWEHLTELADELLTVFPTYEAFRLVMESLAYTEQYETSIQIIDRSAERFSITNLDPGPEQLRIYCLDQLGRMDEAIEHAEVLAQRVSTELNLTNLALLYNKYSQRSKLLGVATQIRDLPKADPQTLLFTAELVSLDSEQLAIELWEKINLDLLPDESVAPAVLLGLRLGLEGQTGKLSERMQRLGAEKRAGVEAGDFKDLVQKLQERSQFQQELWNEYLSGLLPIHVTGFGPSMLYQMYQLQLEANLQTHGLVRVPILMARHGSRPILSTTIQDLPKITLTIDITSLLLANYLGILGAVEKVFAGRIYVPVLVYQILSAIEHDLIPNNPERIRAAKQINRLLRADNSHLNILDELPEPSIATAAFREQLSRERIQLYEFAHNNNGWIVSFLPLRKPGLEQELALLDEAEESQFFSRRAVAEILLHKGYISQHKFDAIKNYIFAEPGVTEKQLSKVHRYSVLVIDRGIAISLAELGLLETACRFFEIHLTDADVEEVKGLIQVDQTLRDQREQVQELSYRVSQGRGRKVYHLIPNGQGGDEFDIVTRSLETIFSYLPNSDGIHLRWVDDRYVNGFPFPQSNVVGINEVLKFLFVSSEITEAEYYSYIHKLRKANVRFIPPEVTELVYILRNTPINSGLLEETEDLITFREYIASCMVRKEDLQRTPQNDIPDSSGEIMFFSSVMELARNTLQYIWEHIDQLEQRAAYSNWLASELMLDYATFINPDAAAQMYPNPLQVSLATLILLTFSTQEKTDAYRNWLEARILDIRFENDRLLVVGVAEQIKFFFRSIRRQIIEQRQAQTERISFELQRIYDTLPDKIRSAMLEDEQFLLELGYIKGSFIHLGMVSVTEDAFWTSLAEAVNEGSSKIQLGEEISIFFTSQNEDDHIRLYYQTSDMQNPERLNIFLPEVLKKDPDARITALHSNRNRFECDNSEFEKLITIVSNDDVIYRMKVVEAQWRTNYTRYYSELWATVVNQNEFRWSLALPPSIRGMLAFLRIYPEPSSDFSQTLSVATSKLIDEIGTIHSLVRLSGLPIALPAIILENVQSLSAENKRIAIKHLLNVSGSPISQLHLLRVLILISSEDPIYKRLARRIITTIFSDRGISYLVSFLSILNWVSRSSDIIPGYDEYPAEYLLVATWVHAHHLLSVLRTRFPQEDIMKNFQNADYRGVYQQYLRDKEYWLDASYPKRMDAVIFLVEGLAYACGIDKVFIEEANIANYIENIAFFEQEENIYVPARTLLLASTQMTNLIHSFFGGDRGVNAFYILPVERTSSFSQTSLHKLVESIVSELQDDPAKEELWTLIDTIFVDLPSYSDLQTQIHTVLTKLDFNSLIEQNTSAWWPAIRFGLSQNTYMQDATQSQHLRSAMNSAAHYFRTIELSIDESQRQNVASELVNLAFRFCVTNYSSEAWIHELQGIFEVFLTEWNATLPDIKSLLQYLYETLPVDLSKTLIPLLVRVRAG